LQLKGSSGNRDKKRQNSFELYRAVREQIAYVHIKDGYLDDTKPVFTFPGEGKGYVREILSDLLKTGYDGGFSIEPHMAVIFHNDSVKPEAEIRYWNYVEYGRRVEKMLDEIKKRIT